MLFETAIEMYMADRAKRLRATTLEGYESAIRRHIAPAWAWREVESITCEELQSWVDSIPTAGGADKAFKTFRQIYRWVMRKHQLRIWDVTQGIELPKRRMAKRERMTAAEERRMLREVMGKPYEAVVLAGAALGRRPSGGGPRLVGRGLEVGLGARAEGRPYHPRRRHRGVRVQDRPRRQVA